MVQLADSTLSIASVVMYLMRNTQHVVDVNRRSTYLQSKYVILSDDARMAVLKETNNEQADQLYLLLSSRLPKAKSWRPKSDPLLS